MVLQTVKKQTVRKYRITQKNNKLRTLIINFLKKIKLKQYTIFDFMTILQLFNLIFYAYRFRYA